MLGEKKLSHFLIVVKRLPLGVNVEEMSYSILFIMCTVVFHSYSGNNIYSGKYILDIRYYITQ